MRKQRKHFIVILKLNYNSYELGVGAFKKVVTNITQSEMDLTTHQNKVSSRLNIRRKQNISQKKEKSQKVQVNSATLLEQID